MIIRSAGKVMVKIMKQALIRKTAASALLFAMTLAFAACGKDQGKYSLSNINLTETQRTWSNPDEKYGSVLDKFADDSCTGTYAVATDKDVVYLYAEKEFEKDGMTLESQDTVFDIASVSKTFTAVCVLQLMERGKLKLEDTLDKFFPEYEKGKKITINDLLHMSSGIPDYCNNPDPFWNISGAEAADKMLSDIYLDKVADEQFLAALYKAPLAFEPGSAYEYSNTNYRLLAFIIEKLSGMKYCDYVKKNIFDKCGMKKTTSMATGDMTYKPVDFEELVKYGFTDKNGYPACPNNSRGDGGIHSCVSDMVRFDRALFGGKLLNNASMEMLLKEENGYCCGLTKEENGYSHSGSSFTCTSNNKIVESGEFGHIYVIKLERRGAAPQNSDDPMAGTRYTKGTFSDGVYVNEYARIRFNVPEGFVQDPEKELAQRKNMGISFAETKKDKTLLKSQSYDASFWEESTSICFEFSFFNIKQAMPGDPAYNEDKLLTDYIAFNRFGVKEAGGTQDETSREKIKLGGVEYLRAETVVSIGEMRVVYYARKLDDDIICLIAISFPKNRQIEEFEKMFVG